MDTFNLVSIKVWDAPIRLFHWGLVLLLGFQLLSGKLGGNLMLWHLYCGYTVLALVIFRVLWGFAGSTHARFANFLASPAASMRFASRLFSREAAPHIGHNPLGGWMVVALLLSLALQAMSGLFANDDIATEGPLAAFVSKATSDRLTTVHRWNLKFLLLLAFVHVAAVLYHWLVKKENLVGAMFTGIKRVPQDVARGDAAARFASPWRALALLVVALAAVYVVVKL